MTADTRTASTAASLSLVAGLFGLFLPLIFLFELSWDEFFLLEWVHLWNKGELTLPLQTMYIRAFSWLPQISSHEVDQLIAARAVILGGLAVTCTFIYATSRRFFSIEASALAVAAFLTFSLVFRNASSFRADGVVIPLLMGICFLLTGPHYSRGRIVLIGFLIGFAGMVTVKAILYTPLFALILFARWWRANWQRKEFLEAISMALVALATFALLYVLHSASIPQTSSGSGYLATVTGSSFLANGLFPRGHQFILTVITNPVFYILLLLGLHAISQPVESELGLQDRVTRLAFILPLLSIVFYEHAYGYFYPFMLAPASIVLAAAIDRYIVARGKPALLLLGIFLAGKGAYWANISYGQNMDYQRQVVSVTKEIFPQPTDYIDLSAMISSYPKHSELMLSWNSGYLQNKVPVMPGILEKGQPKFVLANIESLNLDSDEIGRPIGRLLPEDRQVLRNNYIHHWGPVYVAGKAIDIKAKPAKFQIVVAGIYTLESTASAVIDGQEFAPGQTVLLEKGQHTVMSAVPGRYTLRWGKSLERPTIKPLGEHVFHGY